MDDRKPASMKDFKERLGMRESGGKYDAKNSLGYLGKYQFGGMALQDLGYKDNKGNWTGKDGIKSEEDFLKNDKVQERAMDRYAALQRKYLKNYGANNYVGKNFKGVPITESGLLAAAHLIGAKGLSQAIKNDEDRVDGYGTKASEYLKKFQGINLDEEEKVDKLKKLQDMKQKLTPELSPADPAKELGFACGGVKGEKYQDGGVDILSQMGLPELKEDGDLTAPVGMEYTEPEMAPVVDSETVETPVAKEVTQEPESKQNTVSEAIAERPDVFKPIKDTSDLEQRYLSLMKESEDAKKTANWATAATHIASMLDKFSARPVGIQPIQFEADIPESTMQNLIRLEKLKQTPRNNQMTDYQKKALELREKELGLKSKKAEEAPSFEQKEEKKAEIKQRLADKKEEKEVKKTAESALEALDSQEQFIDNALKMLEEEGASTGPLDQYIAPLSEKGQKLRKALNNIALDKMTKMFAGMSKAIDSDAERAFFQSTQPSMADYESVNIDTLNKLKDNIESLRAKTKKKLSGEDVSPNATTEESIKTVVKKQYSPSRDKTKITYSDGSEEIVNGRQ